MAACDHLADKLYSQAERFGRLNHEGLVISRFHLSASLLTQVPPNEDFRLLSPAALVRDFLAEVPLSVRAATDLAPGWAASLNVAEIRALSAPKSLLVPLMRVDDLFPQSADLEVYQEWKELGPVCRTETVNLTSHRGDGGHRRVHVGVRSREFDELAYA
jgi:hypothetical protein